jgi:membrane protein implicated in regulation of membrane protease activity
MLLILGLILVLLLPAPWSFVGFAVCFVLFLGELAVWHRTVRGLPRVVGRRRLIGADGVVISECRPDGQVRVGGEIWAARCEAGAAVGDRISVTRLEGLVLVVQPKDQAKQSPALD